MLSGKLAERVAKQALQQKKQQELKVVDGRPSLSKFIEGQIALHFIDNTLYMVVRKANRLHYNAFTDTIS